MKHCNVRPASYFMCAILCPLLIFSQINFYLTTTKSTDIKSIQKLLGTHIGASGGSVVECLTRDRGVAGFESLRRHCIVPLSKTLDPLLSTGSTQEDLA